MNRQQESIINSDLARRNHERIMGALVDAPKRMALAAEMGIDEGQLSKLIRGDLRRLCELTSLLGLEIFPADYVTSIERVLKERL